MSDALGAPELDAIEQRSFGDKALPGDVLRLCAALREAWERNRELGEALQQCKRAMDGLAEHHPDMVSLAMRAARLRAARLLAEMPKEEQK